MAEGDGLLNRYTGKTVSRVRIPLSPPILTGLFGNFFLKRVSWGMRASQILSVEFLGFTSRPVKIYLRKIFGQIILNPTLNSRRCLN